MGSGRDDQSHGNVSFHEVRNSGDAETRRGLDRQHVRDGRIFALGTLLYWKAATLMALTGQTYQAVT